MFEIEMANGFQSDWELDTLDEAKKIQGAIKILEFNDNLDVIRQYDLVDGKWIRATIQACLLDNTAEMWVPIFERLFVYNEMVTNP